MKVQWQESDTGGTGFRGSVDQWLRGGVGCLGVVLILIGLVFAISILGGVWTMVNDAELLSGLASNWGRAVQGGEPVLRISDVLEFEPPESGAASTGAVAPTDGAMVTEAAPATQAPSRIRIESDLSGPVGLIFLLLFLFFLGWFTLGLMAAGGKLVSLMLPEHLKVKDTPPKTSGAGPQPPVPPERVDSSA